MAGVHGCQERDPVKAAEIIVELAHGNEVPLRLPLGREAVERISGAYKRYLAGLDLAGPVTSRSPDGGIAHRVVRVEPLGLLLPERHPLAGIEPLPIAELRDRAVCHRAGNHVTAEWVQYDDRLLSSCNAQPVPDHPPVRGSDVGYHLRPDEPPSWYRSTIRAHPARLCERSSILCPSLAGP